MKYILFEASWEIPVYDSILMAIPNSIKADEKLEGMLSGYGNPRVHESGGLVFKNLKALKHYFKGVRDWGVASSVGPDYDSDEKKEERRNITWFADKQCGLKKIKQAMEKEGALNVDMYIGSFYYDEEEECYQQYLEYKRIEGVK